MDWRNRLITLLVCGLVGCGTVPPNEQRYQRLSWAKVGVNEAAARCDAEVQRNIDLSHYTCMRALGWQERR